MECTTVMKLLGLLLVFTTVLAKIPNFIPICKRSNPNFNECIRKATVTIRPHMAKGIPDLNVPSMEPLVVPMVKLEQGTQTINIKVTLRDLKVYGLSDYSFRAIRVELGDKPRISGSVDLSKIRLEANYNISGRVLLVPIRGSGLFTSNATNTLADINMMGSRKEVNNKQYIEMTDTMLKLEFGKVDLSFDKLFNDATLGKVTNQLFRDNSKIILDEIRPAVESVTGMLVGDIVNKVLGSVPEIELFPPS